jgi:sugar transferase EpsL
VYARIVKRVIDVTLSSLALVLLSPLIAITAIGVSVALGRPVFFRQERPGRGGRPFRMIKFRSMTAERDAHGRLLPDGQRLTRFGQLLRSTSLDELPELMNVVRGDMSLVGPRPLLMKYIPLYSPRQARRHEVRPGITGLAQVSGRNAITWEDRLELDVQYVDRLSFRLDVAILCRTALQVIARRGIAHPGRATMDEFRGESLS